MIDSGAKATSHGHTPTPTPGPKDFIDLQGGAEPKEGGGGSAIPGPFEKEKELPGGFRDGGGAYPDSCLERTVLEAGTNSHSRGKQR